MLIKQIKFKPFLSENDKPLKGTQCIINIQEDFIETIDYYSFEELDEEASISMGYNKRQIDCTELIRKDKITGLSYYWADDQSGYFLKINDSFWGFTDREECFNIYQIIKEWLCK